MSIGTIERVVRWYPRIRARLFTILLSSQFQQIGAGSRVVPPFRFAQLHQISLGENVIIHADCWITGLGDPSEKGVKLSIGSHAGIGMGATIMAARQVVIGEYVVLARNVYISDHAHAFKDVTIPISRQGIDNIKPVSIGRHTWLGQNAVVLPGVSIGEHCVIGANSVVNRSVPDFSVAVGAPARVVKTYNKSTGQWEKAS
jgi:acetyltransferase-like isoleucine patch superfamily enzyme